MKQYETIWTRNFLHNLNFFLALFELLAPMAFLSGQVAEEEEEKKRRRRKTKERPPPVTMMNVWGMEVRIVIFGFYIFPHYKR